VGRSSGVPVKVFRASPHADIVAKRSSRKLRESEVLGVGH
jgi:hypothetical protein